MADDQVQSIIDALPTPLPHSHRFVIAIAGPPAAGKTTLAAELAAALSPRAAVLGMDAFHFDDQILAVRGHLDRKGAPHTFDVDGYRRTLHALRSERDVAIAVPVFDRDLELSRVAASMVTAKQPILVTEGNYLLLDERPWTDLAPLFDLTVSLEVPSEVLRERLLDRWRNHGFSDQEAIDRATNNDLPNAHRVASASRRADLLLTDY